MQAARPPILRGVLLLAALAAIAIIMARGDSPAQATTYNPQNNVSVSDPTPGAAADIVINFSLSAPDAFPNVRTHSSIQFIPRQWGVHTPESDGADAAPVGSIAGTFNALSTLGILATAPCIFQIPVPFTMIDASVDTSNTTSPLDVKRPQDPVSDHPGGVGYSGQFVDDPDTLQPPGDLGLPLIRFNANEKHSLFTYSESSTTYRDVDVSGRVTAGDIRLTAHNWKDQYGVPQDPYPAGSVVQPGDADLPSGGIGATLWAFRTNEKHTNPDGNAQMDPGENIYKDLDGSNTVTYGDVRLFHFAQLAFGSTVKDFALPAGVTRYPDFLNQIFPPDVVGEPLARQWGGQLVVDMTAVSLNIVTYRPGQLPGYPASLGYPNIVVLLNPVAPIEVVQINMTSDLCTPLSLTSTNLGVSEDNPSTTDNEEGFVRLTNPKAEKSHDFTLITTSQPDADNDGIENMLDTCPLDPNTEDRDGRLNGEDDEGGRRVPANPDRDNLDGACDPDPVSQDLEIGGLVDDDEDNYGNRADNCATLVNGIVNYDFAYVTSGKFVFYFAIQGDPAGPSNQIDTDGDDIGDACEGAEHGAQCLNDVDDDSDGVVNDGCPVNTIGGESGAQCANAVDDDGDGTVNDGCPQVGSTPDTNCYGNSLDGDGDGYVHDGCLGYSRPDVPETACDDALDDDADGLVNDGCPPVDPGNVAKTTITGHMHVVTLTQGVPIFKHGIKLNNLGGPKNVNSGARTYSVDVSNLGSSAEDVQVGLRVVEGCAAVSGPSSVSVPADGSATASFTVDFTGCAAGTYTVQADACHAGDAAPAGLFGSGACPGASDGMTDPNPLDDAPIAKSVEVGSP